LADEKKKAEHAEHIKYLEEKNKHKKKKPSTMKVDGAA
jgi:hypothetical protein